MIICQNKKATHDFHILERMEAGITLTGPEVKSLREKKGNLTGAYVTARNGEATLHNCDIAAFGNDSSKTHEPKRSRRLLLHKQEIAELERETQSGGKTIVALDLHWKINHVKVTLATAKGKNNADKRQDLKKKTDKREIELATKQKR